MKAISPIVSHTIFVGLTLIIVLTMVTTISSISSSYTKLISQNEIAQACYTVRAAIENIYNPTDYISPTDTVYGVVIVDIPDKIARSSYAVDFIGKNLRIAWRNETFLCSVGFNATYLGLSLSGGGSEISWRRANGTDVISLGTV